MKTKTLVTDAICAAMYVVLASFATLRLGPITLSVNALPVALGAVLFGPLDGLIIGLLGEFISQLLSYGLSATTLLWILPTGLLGLVIGLYARRRQFSLSPKQYLLILPAALLLDTTVTTGVMWVDCLVYKYPFEFYAPYILWRYAADVIKAIAFALILPPLTKAIRKVSP